MNEIDREAFLKAIQTVLGITLAVTIAALIMITFCSCVPKVVYVPTPVPCAVPELPSPPRWPIADFTGKETYGEVLRAFGASLESERGYSQMLETILNGLK
jgi:hypothetical protein